MINIGLGTFKQSQAEIGLTYSQTRTSFLDAAHANFMNAFNRNPFASSGRAYDMTKAYQSSNTYLNRDELNKKYAGLGLNFTEDTREGVVDYIVERKNLENKRANILARGPQSKMAKSFFFLESLGTSFLDPINIGASFVPIVGQARFAAMVARSGKNVARMKKGFREGLVGNAMVEPIVYGVAKAEQADYGAYDAITNIALGGFIGSAAHVGFGRIGDFLAEKRGKPNIYQKLGAISPENQRQLLDYSVGRVLKGEDVNTGNLIVEKTSAGDAQLNKIDDQVSEFNTLYKNALDNGDRSSAKIYLKNIRNLQKTQRDLVEAKRIENDRIRLQEESNMKNRNAKPLTEAEQVVVDKNLTELELEAENIQQRTAFHQKQLNIKDEDLVDSILQERTVIEEIDNSIKNKTRIRDAIKAGTNCTKRNS
tara:strand:+ start:44 stop:1318 length:1275 start_codon:yes stop_codon:yes gene_type:complete